MVMDRVRVVVTSKTVDSVNVGWKSLLLKNWTCVELWTWLLNDPVATQAARWWSCSFVP